MSDPNISLSNVSSILRQAQAYYQENFIADDGRPIARDAAGNDLTISEGAGYTLFGIAYSAFLVPADERAEYQAAFSQVWSWTQSNMQRQNLETVWACPPDNRLCSRNALVERPFGEVLGEEYSDHLFVWRREEEGVIYHEVPGQAGQRDIVTATDADIDIATALFFAALLNWGWPEGETGPLQDNPYFLEANAILGDIWNKEVLQVGDQYYLMASDEFYRTGEGTINPSYFRPAYFSRIFPIIDPSHPWPGLSETSYEVIRQSGQIALGNLEGVNLPPDWISLNFEGNLVENTLHDETTRNDFGWDAFRTLWAVAQDYAWFNNETAFAYMTGESGPQSFILENVDFSGSTPVVFTHDGQPIAARPEDQYRVYATMLSFLAYADGEEAQNAAQIIADRLTNERSSEHSNAFYNEEGYWGNPNDYYTQRWGWFTLALLQGLPEELENSLRELYVPTTYTTEEAALTRALLPPLLFQPDPETGVRTSLGGRAILDRESALERYSLEQIQNVVSAIVERPYVPLPTQFSGPFAEIARLDESYEFDLLGYFTDSSEYWNNTVTLLGLFSQKAIEEGNQANILLAISSCQEIRGQAYFDPNDYNRALLDVVEAELRVQANNQEINFYLEGISLANSAITAMLALDTETARPDYYLITKSLMIIGDLYLKMYETLQRQPERRSESGYFLAKSAEFYNYIINLDAGVNISTTLDTPQGTNSFVVQFNQADMAQSIQFNIDQRYIPEERGAEARTAPEYLQAVAVIKNASLLMQQADIQDAMTISGELVRCQAATQIISARAQAAGRESDFFLSLANIVQADLLLALADRASYELWPGEDSNVTSLSASLDTLGDDLGFSSITANNSLSEREGQIQRIFNLSNQIVSRARELYSGIPADYGYLYSWARIKLMEIVVRRAEFIEKEYLFLVELYNDPVLLANRIPEGEFLSVEFNYIKALLLTSTKRADQSLVAIELLGTVISESAALPETYQLYYQINALLKLAEILARHEEALPAIISIFESLGDSEGIMAILEESVNNQTAALALFASIEAMIGRLDTDTLARMALDTSSILAELHQEWALVLLSMGSRNPTIEHAIIALEYSYASHSAYDNTQRRADIRIIFARFSQIGRRDIALQEEYGRTFNNDH